MPRAKPAPNARSRSSSARAELLGGDGDPSRAAAAVISAETSRDTRVALFQPCPSASSDGSSSRPSRIVSVLSLGSHSRSPISTTRPADHGPSTPSNPLRSRLNRRARRNDRPTSRWYTAGGKPLSGGFGWSRWGRRPIREAQRRHVGRVDLVTVDGEVALLHVALLHP